MPFSIQLPSRQEIRFFTPLLEMLPSTIASWRFLFLLTVLTCLNSLSVNAADVWLGTSNHPLSKGIYHAEFDPDTGKLSPSELAADVKGPGFLALHPSKPILYAVAGDWNGPVVVAYSIESDGKKKTLKPLSKAAVDDKGPCHLSVSADGKMLVTAQYSGGSVGVFKLEDDGSIVSPGKIIKHSGGSGVVGNRQDAPHAHWTGFSPDGRFVFVPDLGMDQIVIYKVDSDNFSLKPHGAGTAIPGGGPRHMKFGPLMKDDQGNEFRRIYVLNELDLSVTVFSFDSEKGEMTPMQTIATVPKFELAKEKFKSASEIRIHPNGKFVYSANRGHDTITVFKIHSDGSLSVVEREPIRGATPRNFNLDPSGRWLLAGGQDSHTLSVFEVDGETGQLTYHRQVVHTPSPICVLFNRD